MGKLIGFITFLIFADLFFLATGQICAHGVCTLTSIIFNAILDVGKISTTQLFSELIGNISNLFNSSTGIAALGASGAVTIGAFIMTKEFRVLLIPIALTLALLVNDFVVIGTYLASLNPILAVFIMAPISIIYILTVVEWLIGKD